MPLLRNPRTGTVVDVVASRAAVLRVRGYEDVAAAPQTTAVPVAADRGTPQLPLERPDHAAKKAEWVAYAESIGIDLPATMTKAEIIDAAMEREEGQTGG